MPKRNQVELSRKLRIETLKSVLEGKDLETIAEEHGISLKGMKYRLTLIYKFYGVKNRYELMALYVKIPSEWYRLKSEGKTKLNLSKRYGNKEPNKNRWKHHVEITDDDDLDLPIGNM